jgi:type VI secretion system secreted protein Hcp
MKKRIADFHSLSWPGLLAFFRFSRRKPMASNVRRLAFCVVIVFAASAAFALPVGQMSCTSSAQTLTFNVSYFDLGVTQTVNIGSASGGAGAGKATFQPLVVHTSFVPFRSLFAAAEAGSHFETCTLTTRNSTGEVIEFTLKIVLVQQVDAIAQSATADSARTAYTEVNFVYGSVQVTSPGSDADDGGSSPANDGWVKVKDRPSN